MNPAQMIMLTVGNCFMQGMKDTQAWNFISPKTSTLTEKLGNASLKRLCKFQLELSHLTALQYLPNTGFVVGFTVAPWEAYYVQTYGLGLSPFRCLHMRLKIFLSKISQMFHSFLAKFGSSFFFPLFFLFVFHILYIVIIQLELHSLFIYKYNVQVGVSWL